MSADKSEVKVATAHAIGVRLDDFLEAVQREVQQTEGAHSALARAAAAVSALLARVDADMDEGKITDLEQAKLAKDWVTRAADVCRALATQSQTQHAQAQGKVAAMTVGVKIVKKFVDDEVVRESARAAQELAAADDKPRAKGRHPGPAIKARRTAKQSGKRGD
jgi:hypothetical protein